MNSVILYYFQKVVKSLNLSKRINIYFSFSEFNFNFAGSL
jgi:hypothetical protein